MFAKIETQSGCRVTHELQPRGNQPGLKVTATPERLDVLAFTNSGERARLSLVPSAHTPAEEVPIPGTEASVGVQHYDSAGESLLVYLNGPTLGLARGRIANVVVSPKKTT